MPLKIKKAYETHVIGFNSKSLPLGLRDDLDLIYQKAKRTNNLRWLDWFEEQPKDKELERIKEERFNQKQLLKGNGNATGPTADKTDSAESTS